MRAAPTPADVAAYLAPGADEDNPATDELEAATARLPLVLAYVRSYTRGVGWSEDGTRCDEVLWAVVVGACAREASNLPGVRREQVGEGYSVLLDDSSGAFTVRELVALNDFRRRAA